MSKKWVIASAAIIVILSATSIFTFAKDNSIKPSPSAEGTVTANKAPNNQLTSVNIPSEEMIAESDDKTVHITGIKTDEGIFGQLKIITSVFSSSAPGYNVSNPTYAPQIISEDLNGNGQQEVVVILTTGYGTGVYQSNVVVYNSEGTRVPVEDANTAFLKQFSGNFSDQGLELNVQGQHYEVPYSFILSDHAHLDARPQIGSIMQYTVEDGVLTATTGVQISPSEFVGDLKLKYSFKNGSFQAGNASFELYPEYST
ncbi:hypothetical protein [Paenibacillus sp.]|jgi:hypothetical protein|uniref:hypothetical protein n=1 Tax=Paenibacillus sp. TaxID=58172 RepID=UPI002836D99A|nr:hypothetical protein [Paenibacillus sp.]MDR0267020.1 hypothetical protein [Paenibacillus sp.]